MHCQHSFSSRQNNHTQPREIEDHKNNHVSARTLSSSIINKFGQKQDEKQKTYFRLQAHSSVLSSRLIYHCPVGHLHRQYENVLPLEPAPQHLRLDHVPLLHLEQSWNDNFLYPRPGTEKRRFLHCGGSGSSKEEAGEDAGVFGLSGMYQISGHVYRRVEWLEMND